MIDLGNTAHRRRKFLVGAFVLLALVTLAAIATTAQSFPRCISGCTANDVELVEVTADVLGSCSPGGTVETDLSVSLYFNRKKTYCVRFVADVYIDGDLAIADMVSEPLNVFSKGSYPNIYFGSVSLPCGSSLSLENVQIMWSVDKNFKNVSDCADGSCAPYGPGSKCTGDQYGTIVISLPLDALNDIAETDEDTPTSIDILANDLLGVEPTQITGLADGTHGSTQENGDGTITYTPDPDFHGIDEFTYTIADRDGNVDAAVVSVTVYPTNDSPAALDDRSETDENVSARIDVLANDADPDGSLDTSSVTIVQEPNHGTLDVDPASGVVTYSPSQGSCGSDSFIYVVQDNEGASSNQATVNINIVCNEPPIAQDDYATTDENRAIEINIVSNDRDEDGSLDLSSVEITSNPSLGSVSVHPSSGLVSYMPDPLSCGDDSFSYTIADDDGGVSNEASVTIAVLCDDPPLAIDDLYHVTEGGRLEPNAPGFLDNDVAGANDALTPTLVTGVSHGTLTLHEDGSFVYVHDGSETTSDQFNYSVSTDTKSSNVATVTLIIQSVNDAPQAVNDAASTNEDTPIVISVLDNDSDPENDVLSVDSVEQPQNGSVSNNGGSVTYTPHPDFHGSDTFSYAATDGNGGRAEAIVTIDVSPENDPPIAQDDSGSTLEDTAVMIDVLDNDSDPDGDRLTIQSVTQPKHGTATNDESYVTYVPKANFNGTDTFAYTIADGNGGTSSAVVTVSVAETNDVPVALDDGDTIGEDSSVDLDVLANDSDPDGDDLFIQSITQPAHGMAVNNETNVTYIPNPNFAGEDEFTYTVCDRDGGHATATVYITVLPTNDPPAAQNDSDSTQEDTPITLDVLSNDSDPDGDTLAVQSTTQPAHGNVVNNGDDVIYSPDLDFSGVDSFNYTLSDGNGGTATATVTITVTPVNDPPVAENDAVTTDEETPVSISVLLNDVDPDGDNLIVEEVAQPAHGTAQNLGTTISYTPNANYNGTDSFTYTVSDGHGETDSATVTIVVSPINDVPIAQDDSAITDEDTLVSIPVIANDSDPDGDFLFVESATSPSNGSILTTETNVSYIPDSGFNGIDSFTYTISDGNGGTASAHVIVAVAAVNDPPEAVDDSDVTDEETAITILVLVNDSDPEGDPLSVQSAAQPANGSVTNNGTSITYIPDTDFHGVDSFAYIISDGNGETATAKVTIAVAAVNDPPIAQDDSGSTSEETATTITALANDSDPDGDSLSIQSATQPSDGTVVNNGTSVTYTPATDFNGIDSFTYTISDGNGGTATANVSIAVSAINDVPIAQDDSASTNEESAIALPVLVNDTDADGDPLSVQSVTQPANGSVIDNGTSITYAPAPDFNGIDSFSYTVSDGNGGTATANVNVTVIAVNDAPIALDDSHSTDEETAVMVSVLTNDYDPDGDPLSVQSATQPANGAIINNGTSITYTPSPDFNGTDSFTYTVSDGNGGTATANVSITVNAVNDAPIAQDDAATTDEDTPVTILVLPNDSDPEGDVLSVEAVSQPLHGLLVFNASSLSYTPDPNFNGVDSLTYTISDGNGGTATANVSVTVRAVNDPPIAQNDSDSTDEETALTIAILQNDSDPDGDVLSVESATQPANGSVVNDGTSVTYTPAENFNGVDSFTYTISDGNGGTATANVSVTVASVNDAPVAQDDSDSTDEETAVTIPVLANDSDPDGDGLAIQSTTQPANGSVVSSGTSVTYTPDVDFNGIDTFTYTISDGNGGIATANVSIAVALVNDPPVAQSDSASTSEETAITITVLANDSDPDGDALSVQSATQPNSGTVMNDGTSVTYTPDPDFNGVDSFTYTVSDNNGGTATANVAITVDAVNDRPVAQNDSASTDEEASITIPVLANDSDSDGDALSIQSATQPANGSVVNNGTSVTYTPSSEFNGSDSFTYTISDGHGGTATAIVDVLVASVNDVPVAQDDSGSTNEETAVTISVLVNDNDPDGDALSIQSATQPTNGSAVNNGTDITYTPDTDFNGTDTFTYTISDGNGGTATANVAVTVISINDAPSAQDDSDSTDEEIAVTIAVLTNDSDLDGDALSVQSATQPANGSVVNNGTSVTYTPGTNFNGIDSFTYIVSDGNGGTATANVTISVGGINDAPVAQDDVDSTNEEIAVTIAVLTNDSDLDGDVLSIQSITQPTNGSVVRNGTSITYTPAPDFNGTDSFTYTLSDGNGGAATATVSVAVEGVNDAPIAQDDSDSTDEETPVTIAVLTNDSDPDGDVLSVQSTTQPSSGSVMSNGTSVTYTPEADFNGVDSFSYTVSDNNGGTATATVSVAVALVNDAPVALDDSDSTGEETALTLSVLANDSDPDGDVLSIQSATQPINGSVVNNSTSITYMPDIDFNGIDSFTYTISDGNGGVATAAVDITVTSKNDAPVALDDLASTPEEASAIIDVLINDSDPDNDGLTIQSVIQPSHGTVVNNGTEVVYTPDAQFNGMDVFTYILTDGNGTTSTATVTVDVTPVNDAPIAQGDSSSTNEGTPITINVLPNDSDPDGDTLSIQSVTQPANGSVSNNGTNVTYTPAPQFDGVDSFSYTISDGNGETATATVTVAVATTNDPPTALDDEAVTGEDTSVTILVLSNDSDPENDALSVLSTSQPLHGSVVANGTSIIYTPDLNYIGGDSLSYTVSDGRGGTATATIAIDVLPVNDAPVAQDDIQTMQEGATVNILVLSNDTDPDNDPLRVESISQPLNGTVTNNGSSLAYEPNPGHSGTDTFTYTVADNQGGTSTARVTILVSPLNDLPIAQDDSVTTDEDLLVVIPILANDSDPDGDFLLIESFTEPLNGSVLNSRTSLSYIPNPGFQGIDTFTYTVSDGNGGSAQAIVTVSVSEVNESPIAQDDSAITDEGIAVTILSLLNDSDPDGDPLVIESIMSPDNGEVSIVGSELLYTPDPQFAGVDTLTYTISDGRGGTSTATVFIAVAAVNDVPTAQDDSIMTIESEGAFIPVLNNDSDPDGDPLSILSVTQPQNGSVTVSGTDLLYEPDDGFNGTDSFSYTIADDSGSTSTATVTVGVDPLIAGSGGAAVDDASCNGRVIISEIAWAGTAADARDEWIELRNLGTTPVDLAGWVIRWRSTHPSTPEDQIWKIIELEGILPAASKAACDPSIQNTNAGVRIENSNDTTWLISAEPDVSGSGYYVLERRTDDTVQNRAASQIYDADRTLSLDLSDLGEVVMLINKNDEIVDTANSSNLGRNGWVAGSTITRGSMERIDPLKPDTSDNWQTNFGLVIAGNDSAGHPLRATPGITNSPDLETIKAIAAISPESVRAGEMLQADFSLTRQDRRTAGWPWISVIRPGFTGISGAGGAVDYTAYAFSGSHQNDSQYALEISTSNLSTGSYNFWIIYGFGRAVYVPVIVSP
jgi:large repetitive protein